MRTRRSIGLVLLSLGLVGIHSGILCASEDDSLRKIAVHGFVSQGYLHSSHNNYQAVYSENGSLQFNELGINFSTEPLPDLRIGIQLLSRDQGVLGNNEIDIDWGYADYRWKDSLGFRVGKIKLPLGLYNEVRDLDMLRTSVLLPQGVYDESFRDVITAAYGVGAYGHKDLRGAGGLDYDFVVGTLDIDDDGGVARGAESGGFLDIRAFNVNELYSGGLRWNSPGDMLALKTSFAWSSLDADAVTTMPLSFGPGPPIPAGTPVTIELKDTRIVIYSAEYARGDLVVSSELMNIRRTDSTSLLPGESTVRTEGYHVNASYRFNALFELGGYYSVYYPNADDKSGATFGDDYFRAWLKDFAISTRFDLSDSFILKLETHVMDGAAQVSRLENSEFERDWYLFALKVTFTF